MIKEAIVKIVNKEDLTYDEAYTVMNGIMGGETTATQNAAHPSAPSCGRNSPRYSSHASSI